MRVAHWMLRRLSALMSTLWVWFRVIWVCRVPVASVVGGGLLVAATPQARDFFADLGISWWQWGVFIALVFLWAWIAHAAARRALQHDDWVPEAHTEAGLTPQRRAELHDTFYWPALIVPRALGVLTFFFVGLAIYRTHYNVAGATALPEAARAASLSFWLVIAMAVTALVYVAVIWNWSRSSKAAVPGGSPSVPDVMLAGTVPFPARGSMRTPTASLIERSFYVGRFIVFGLLLYAIVDPHGLGNFFPRLFFVPLLFAGVVLLLGELAAWSHRLRTPLLLIFAGLAGICLYAVDQFHDVRWIAANKANPEPRQIGLAEAVARWRKVNDCEEKSGKPCPRPILIAGAGGASRAAFLTATFTGALMDLDRDPRNLERYGSVRNRIFALSTVSGSSVGAVVMRAAMTDAALVRGKPLSPPCIATRDDVWFSDRSPAQGGPFNVTTSWRDCFQALVSGDFLSPVVVGLVYRDNFPLANPVTNAPLWPDRARLLEQGFERRYRQFTQTGQARTCKDTADPQDSSGLCRPFGYHPDPQAAGAWIPLLFINGTSVSTGRRIIVSDIPIGQKFSAPDEKGQPVEQTFLPFAYDLWELRDHLKCRGEPNVLKCRSDYDDIRLSTAAGISARFPVISPHGLIRFRTSADAAPDYSGQVVDRVVDGGYFENDGLATIADLASGLGAWKLDPVVFRVVNEPTKTVEANEMLGEDRPPVPNDSERTPFDDALSIIRTLTSTRSGHEDGHAAYLRSVLGDDKKKKIRLYEIGVHSLDPNEQSKSGKQLTRRSENQLCRHVLPARASMGQVSMSWWMSQPVQAYLDAQLCVGENWEQIKCELENGGRAGRMNCVPDALGPMIAVHEEPEPELLSRNEASNSEPLGLVTGK